jgi:hypothetical protein
MYAFFAEPGLSRRAGFRTMTDEGDSRNVLSAMPGDAGYSSLWALSRLAKEDFINVAGLTDIQTKLTTPPVAYGSAINAVVLR